MDGGLTRPTEPAAPDIKTVSPSFNLPTSNIPYLSAEVVGREGHIRNKQSILIINIHIYLNKIVRRVDVPEVPRRPR